MDQPIWQIKKELCDIGYRIWHRGFCAGNEGNHSVRVSEDRILCTPTGLSKGFLTPDDICVVDMDGNQVEHNAKGRKRTSEVKVHIAIYEHRPDVKAVVHSHPPHATAFAVAGIPLPEGIHPEAEVFLGKVPLAPYALPSTKELPDSILPLIGPETNTVLMGSHGSVCFDKDLTGAYYKLEILDAYARILLFTLQLKKVNVFNERDITRLLEVKQGFGLPDARLSCAPTGCIGTDNEAFLSLFDPANTPGAACGCNDGGKVTSHTGAQGGNAPAVDEAAFESMVQSITEQIISGMKN